MKKIKNRTTFVLLVLFLLMLSSSFFVFPISAAPKPKSSQISLNIVVTSEQYASINDIKDDFLASEYGNGIDSVTVTSSGDTADDQLTYIQTRMSTQDTSLDVVGMDVVWTALFAENGWIINLDSYLEPNEMDKYIGGMVDSGKYNGSQWAFPYFFNLGVLYYRKDLLTKYGYDETDIDTWAELNATANDILEQENDPNLVGYIAQFDNYEGGTVNFQEWIGSNGATAIFDAQGNPDVTTTKIIQALTFLQDLIAPSATTDLRTTGYIINRDALTYNEGLSEEKWSNGEAIFCRQWPYVYGITILNTDLNATDGMGNYTQFGVAPIPTFSGAAGEKSSCVGGAILGISAYSEHKAAAYNLTKWLCSNYSQYYALDEYAHPPALKETYTTIPPGQEWVEDFYLASGVTLARPKNKDYPDISNAISDRFSQIISGQSTPTAGMDNLQKDIEDILNPPPEVIPGYELSIILIAIASMMAIAIVFKKKKVF
ncbi:MAG: extracellular solute-binding protein [Promethearchaeota archaeon]